MNGADAQPVAGNHETACAVCGKETAGGRGFMNLTIDGRRFALCCPLCCQTFADNREVYVQRRRAVEMGRNTLHGM